MTRIRYKREGKLLVSPPLLAVSDLIVVTLNEDTLTAEFQRNSDKPVSLFKHTNMQNLKKAVKGTLKEMGVVFESEVRPRFTNDSEKELTKAMQDQIVFGTGLVKLDGKGQLKHVPIDFDEDGDDFL